MSASMRREETGGPFDLSSEPLGPPVLTSPVRNTRRSTPTPSPHTTPDRSSSPGPSRHYAFPPPHADVSAPLRTPISPTTGTHPLHRASVGSMRSRRPSPLLHEIQPPSRRLSSHQMLLLTPFGGALPAGVLPNDESSGGAMSMGRGSSSMGRSPLPFGPLTSSLPDAPSQYPRSRHRSLGQHSVPTAPSQFVAAPMATIPSASDYGSSSGGGSAAPSRGPSNHSHHSVEMEDRVPSLVGGMPGSVHMTRSNSLPILTLRELEALRHKDGELGIARGGDWAWVSTEDEVIQEEMSPISPSRSQFPFTAFNDPFAQPGQVAAPQQPTLISSLARSSASSTMSREHPSYSSSTSSSSHEPRSTLPGYHYSPTYNDTRRMSEAPSLASLTSRGPGSPASTIGRRPSAPITAFSRSSIMTTSSSSSNDASTSIGPSPRASQIKLEEGDDRRRSLSPQRPKIARYKSLPGRSEGLGLEIVVRPQDVSTGPNTGSSTDSRRPSSSSRRGSSTRRTSRNKGSWAAVDVVDTLSMSDLRLEQGSTSTSPLSSARQSIASVGTGSRTSPQTASSIVTTGSTVSIPESIFLIEEIIPRSHLVDFGVPDKGKDKDKVGPSGEGFSGSYVAALAQNGWNATFPRRGSLAMLTKTALAPWAGNSDLSGLGVGDKDRVESVSKHWSERRGSWAEGWGKV